MEQRIVKIMTRKAGWTASKNAEKYSVNLPAGWLSALGVSKDDWLELSFDGEKIMIQAAAATDLKQFRSKAQQQGH